MTTENNLKKLDTAGKEAMACMNENASSYEAKVEELVDAYVRHIEGSEKAPNLTLVDPTIAAEATKLFRLLDATWGSDIDLPPLDEDPVAIALGLVHPAGTNALGSPPKPQGGRGGLLLVPGGYRTPAHFPVLGGRGASRGHL